MRESPKDLLPDRRKKTIQSIHLFLIYHPFNQVMSSSPNPPKHPPPFYFGTPPDPSPKALNFPHWGSDGIRRARLYLGRRSPCREEDRRRTIDCKKSIFFRKKRGGMLAGWDWLEMEMKWVERKLGAYGVPGMVESDEFLLVALGHLDVLKGPGEWLMDGIYTGCSVLTISTHVTGYWNRRLRWSCKYRLWFQWQEP